MKKLNGLKRVLTLALALVFVLSVAFVPKTAYAYDGAADVRAVSSISNDLTGKTIILHTNDVHGAVDKYAKVTALKEGKTVITAKVGKKRLKCKVTVTASRKKIYAKYRKAIKKLDWPTAVFAAVDIDGNGINEVIVEDIVPNGTDFHPERKGVILYYENGLKRYQYGPALDTFEAINSNKQLVFGRTRGKAIISIYSFSRAEGVKSVTGFFTPYLSEDEAAQMDTTYFSDLKYPKFYPVSSANLKTYLGGKGMTTGTSDSYADKGLSNV